MKQHFTEADLLETYYTRPGESLPIMMHLADCAECAERYERLERKMQTLRSCAHDQKPETFWARQRLAIMRKVDARRTRTPLSRMAAAAVVVLGLGGLVAWQLDESPQPPAAPPAVTVVTVAAPTVEESPWQSEELSEYETLVDWESWVEDPS